MDNLSIDSVSRVKAATFLERQETDMCSRNGLKLLPTQTLTRTGKSPIITGRFRLAGRVSLPVIPSFGTRVLMPIHEVIYGPSAPNIPKNVQNDNEGRNKTVPKEDVNTPKPDVRLAGVVPPHLRSSG